MLDITTRLNVRRDVYPVEIRDRLILPFELRQKSRFRARLESGTEAAVILTGGEILRGGDLLVASNGHVIEVVAQPERVMQAACASAYELARAAYHLGNRHVALQIGNGWLRIADDHVLSQMLEGLGLVVTPMEAPFEPEKGAYGHHDHSHVNHLDDSPPTHGGVIHQFGEFAGVIKPGAAARKEHGHSHNDGHAHSHDHSHGHDHDHNHGK